VTSEPDDKLKLRIDAIGITLPDEEGIAACVDSEWALIFHRATGKILWANSRAEEFFSFPRGEMRGEHLEAVGLAVLKDLAISRPFDIYGRDRGFQPVRLSGTIELDSRWGLEIAVVHFRPAMEPAVPGNGFTRWQLAAAIVFAGMAAVILGMSFVVAEHCGREASLKAREMAVVEREWQVTLDAAEVETMRGKYLNCARIQRQYFENSEGRGYVHASRPPYPKELEE
jgi:hypothetical protein